MILVRLFVIYHFLRNFTILTNREAIWDNRSVYHAATPDYDANSEERTGQRAVSLGEKPYFDPGSKSRQEALSLEGPTKKEIF
jgi:hypothetical protein